MVHAYLNSSFLNYLDSVYWTCSVMANPIQPVLHPITIGGAKCSISVPFAAIDMMTIFKWIHLTSYPMTGAVQSAKP